MQDRGPQAYVAEFIGTFALVMFILMSVVLFVDAPVRLGFMIIGLVHAFALSMLFISLGGISGGHFNPAITFGMALIRKIKPADAVVYILLQLAGGVLAALFTKAILLDEGKALNYGALAVSKMVNPFQGFLVEAVMTFFLVWAFVAVLYSAKAPREWAGWVIGATLGLIVFIGGPLTGGGFNPARWFAPALVGGEWGDFWLFILGPLVGGGLAALVYWVLFIGGNKKPAKPKIGEETPVSPKPEPSSG